MEKRTYIVKQEKGSNLWDVADMVAGIMFTNPEIDFADRNGWGKENEDEISLTDRYWEVIVKVDEPITLKEADVKFEIENGSSIVEIGLKEVYMIM